MATEEFIILGDRANREAVAKETGVLYQEDYEVVLAEAASLRLSKARSYGESRYEEPDEDFNMGGVHWDIYRKFIRLKQMFKLGWREVAWGPDGLREALMDMANYCLMGVQLIDQYVKPVKVSTVTYPIEQIAIYCEHPKALKDCLRLIGVPLDSWSDDVVDAIGTVGALDNVPNIAELSFNYELIPGIELELIRYQEGANWLANRSARKEPGLSHLGVHIGPEVDLDQVISLMRERDIHVAQNVITNHHTNPAIAGKRRYHYVVFDTIDKFGFDLKLIRRLNQDGSTYEG